jgi:ProP effector
MKRRATAMLTALAQRWPRCFDLERPRPLKIAIHKDIIAEMRRAETDLAFETDLRLAMRLYTGSPAYLMALAEGAVRIDLQGEPSGLVKEPHAGFAKYRLRRMEGR